MDIDKVYEFSAGKNDWNTIEVGVHDGRIIIRDDIGMLEFDDGDVDQLVRGIDQARRRLREDARVPTKTNADDDEPTEEPQDVEEPAADEPAVEDEDNEDSSTDEEEGTGLGPQFPGSDPSF